LSVKVTDNFIFSDYLKLGHFQILKLTKQMYTCQFSCKLLAQISTLLLSLALFYPLEIS